MCIHMNSTLRIPCRGSPCALGTWSPCHARPARVLQSGPYCPSPAPPAPLTTGPAHIAIGRTGRVRKVSTVQIFSILCTKVSLVSFSNASCAVTLAFAVQCEGTLHKGDCVCVEGTVQRYPETVLYTVQLPYIRVNNVLLQHCVAVVHNLSSL